MSQTIKIAKSACAGFSWTPDGKCHGVLLRAASDGCKVASVWSVECSGKTSVIAENLAAGRKALGLGEKDYCIAGPANGGWGMGDVRVPSLKGEEMKAALSFELRKLTPLPVERLTWGYRVIADADSSGMCLVRVFYVKTEVWRKWLEASSGLRNVDMISAAPVLLDPMLDKETVVFPGNEGFAYVPGATGRDIMPASASGSGAATMAEMLPCGNLKLGELEQLSAEKQAEYIPALVMAMYGLGKEISKDQDSMPALPSGFRPRRYFLLQAVACILVFVIIVCLGIGVLKGMQQRSARLRLIRKDMSAVQAEIKEMKNRTSPTALQAATNLEAELDKLKFDAPEMADVLIELTNEIKSPAWMAGSFDWSTDFSSNVVPIVFTIREPAGDTANADISARLNNSPLLGDVAESRSTVNKAGQIERRFVLKARYDTAEEQEALRKSREEAAQKKESEARDEKAEAENKNDAGYLIETDDEDADEDDEDFILE